MRKVVISTGLLVIALSPNVEAIQTTAVGLTGVGIDIKSIINKIKEYNVRVKYPDILYLKAERLRGIITVASNKAQIDECNRLIECLWDALEGLLRNWQDPEDIYETCKMRNKSTFFN